MKQERDRLLAVLNEGKVGRPYKRTHEEKLTIIGQVFMAMEEGRYTFRGACGVLGMAPGTVMQWMRELPAQAYPHDKKKQSELLNAIREGYDRAQALREAYWQDVLKKGGQTTTAAIFALKCSVGAKMEWDDNGAPMLEVVDEDGGDGSTRVNINFTTEGAPGLDVEDAEELDE